ncbi:MAG: glycosyltransferase family 4 protein [Acidobacteriota bacterium]
MERWARGSDPGVMSRVVLINALASTAGGGRTWLRNVLPRLARLSPAETRWIVLVPPGDVDVYRDLVGAQVEVETVATSWGLAGRWWWEQTGLRQMIASRQIDLLVSVGNFALWKAPVAQILFNRSDLNFSAEFLADLQRRGEWGKLLSQLVKSLLARISIATATLNVVPTAAFGERIRRATGRDDLHFEVLPFGFDAPLFRAEQSLTVEEIRRLREERRGWRLLYVSHYNYFRNFETLLRALPQLNRLALEKTGRSVELVLTTRIARGARPGGYDASKAAALIDALELGPYLRMLGEVPYAQLHHLYKMCDLFVCPSYSESFGHPLLEAMASGLPVATADLPVHREVGGDAVAAFAPFDPDDLARCCAELLADEPGRLEMRRRGLARAGAFSWDRHVSGLVELAAGLLNHSERRERNHH